MRGGAIILLQLDDLGARKVLLELQDIGHFRAAPRVDRLVVVPHHADILAVLCEQAEPKVLDLVGVLIFVDQDVFEAVLVLLQHIRMLPEDVEHVQQQIAEIASVQRLQARLIGLVQLSAASVGVGFILHRIEIARVQPAVLPPVDQPGQLARGPALLVQIGLRDQRLEQAQLIVGVDDREVRLQADQLGMAAQHLRPDRVERAEPRHAFDRVADMAAHTFAHLARGLVGEGDAQDLARPGEAHGDQMRQPRRQRCGLARPGTRQHQDGSLGRRHRLALGWIQALRIGGQIVTRRGGGKIGHGVERTGRERRATVQALRRTECRERAASEPRRPLVR